MIKTIGVGTVGAVGAAAPPIFGQGVQTMHSAPPMFGDDNPFYQTQAQYFVYNRYDNLISIAFFQT